MRVVECVYSGVQSLRCQWTLICSQHDEQNPDQYYVRRDAAKQTYIYARYVRPMGPTTTLQWSTNQSIYCEVIH